MCAYEPTGAIVAAMTTSIPEAPHSARNWDYRYCWERDAFFVLRALNSLSAVRTMENYFRWIMNIVDDALAGHIQPVYGIALESRSAHRTSPALPRHPRRPPVRLGHQAPQDLQNHNLHPLLLDPPPAFFHS